MTRNNRGIAQLVQPFPCCLSSWHFFRQGWWNLSSLFVRGTRGSIYGCSMPFRHTWLSIPGPSWTIFISG